MGSTGTSRSANLGKRGFCWSVDLHKARSWNPRSPVPGVTRTTAFTEPYGLPPHVISGPQSDTRPAAFPKWLLGLRSAP